MSWVRSLRTDLAVGVVVARAEIRDRFRRTTSSRRKRALFVFLALFAVPGVVLFVRQAYAVGVLTREGVGFPVVAAARNLLVPGMAILAVVAGLEAVQQLGNESVRPLVLTSAPTRAVVIGKVLSLLASWLVLFGMGFSLVLAYAAGARAPIFVLSIIAAGLPIFVLVLLSGLAVGYLLWLGVDRIGLSKSYQQLLTATLYIVVLGGIYAGSSLLGEGAAEGGIRELLPTGEPLVPIGWYADLFFLGSPMEPTIGMQTLGAVLTVTVAIGLTFGLVVRLAPRYWYATPGESESADASAQIQPGEFDETPGEGIGRTADSVFGRSRTLRAALGYTRSSVRDPGQFVYLFYYLFPVAPVLAQQAVGNPALFPTTAGATLIVLGVWLAGGVFCLNPLGAEGTMLSQLVLAPAPAETFVHARLLAGTLLGLVVSVSGLAVVTATVSAVTPTLALLGLGFLACTVLTSAAFALGIGSVLPKFEAVEIFESVETLAPSIFAAVIHGFVATLLLAGGFAGTLAVGWTGSPLSIPARIGVVVVFVAAIGVIADGSRRYAAARLRDYGRAVVRTDRPFAIYTVLALAAGAFLLGQAISLGVIFLLGARQLTGVFVPLLFIIEYLGYVLVAVGFLYVTRRGVAYLDIRLPSPREIGIVAVGVVLSFGLWAAGSVLISELGLPAADHAAFDAEEDGTPTLLLSLIPLMLLVNGPVEELLYRNVIQKFLTERFSRPTAIAVASAVFALAHVPAYVTAGFGPLLVTLSLLFVVSSLWGTIYVWTESLVVVSAIHGLYNALLVFGLYLSIS
ncbi:type II CAAX endopeptidase family protein [Halobacteriaceae archaeon SHR40]|uniref:CPBP family intramembrane glutamic endopeptidase n=1 Tax=Halovenus amylolytica TaxID=2500550 RepID=UPI000FE2E557